MELLICIDALQPRLGQADHRRPPLFRLCPAGPEARAAHADLGQAGRQSDHRRRRQPGALGRSPRRPDPGLLRHPDRQSLRRAGDVGGHPGALLAAGRSPSSRPTSAAWCAPARSPSGSTTPRSPSSTSAASEPGESEVMNIIGDVDGPLLHPDRRHRRFGRHALQRRRRAEARPAPRTSSPMSPTACCRAARSRGSTNRRSSELVITDSIAATKPPRRAPRSASSPSRRCSPRRSAGSRTKAPFRACSIDQGAAAGPERLHRQQHRPPASTPKASRSPASAGGRPPVSPALHGWIRADLNRLTAAEAWAPHVRGVRVVINASGALQTGARDRLGNSQDRAITP